ncbi:MAG: hypothetical protein U0R17_02415 [Acidimicrobiia bacterium]
MTNAGNKLQIELHVPDFAPVLDFYGKLGFKTVSHKLENEFGDYLVMEREGVTINFWPGSDLAYRQSHFSHFPKDAKRGYGVELIIPVTNIETFYEDAKQFANIVGDLKQRHWGAKDFRVVDPFGYYLRFSENI